MLAAQADDKNVQSTAQSVEDGFIMTSPEYKMKISEYAEEDQQFRSSESEPAAQPACQQYIVQTSLAPNRRRVAAKQTLTSSIKATLRRQRRTEGCQRQTTLRSLGIHGRIFTIDLETASHRFDNLSLNDLLFNHRKPLGPNTRERILTRGYKLCSRYQDQHCYSKEMMSSVSHSIVEIDDDGIFVNISTHLDGSESNAMAFAVELYAVAGCEDRAHEVWRQLLQNLLHTHIEKKTSVTMGVALMNVAKIMGISVV